MNMIMAGLHDNVNCDDPVKRNGFGDVFNCDDARAGSKEGFPMIDADKLVHINVEVGDGVEKPTFLPFSRLSRVSLGRSSEMSEVELN